MYEWEGHPCAERAVTSFQLLWLPRHDEVLMPNENSTNIGRTEEEIIERRECLHQERCYKPVSVEDA